METRICARTACGRSEAACDEATARSTALRQRGRVAAIGEAAMSAAAEVGPETFTSRLHDACAPRFRQSTKAIVPSAIRHASSILARCSSSERHSSCHVRPAPAKKYEDEVKP